MAEKRMGVFDQFVYIAGNIEADIGQFLELSAAESAESKDSCASGLGELCRFDDVW